MKDVEKFLNQRSSKFTIILNDNELHLFKNAKNIVKQVCCNENLCVLFIASILHDSDVDDSTKHVKTSHYHLVVSFDRIYRLGTIINYLSDTFHCNKNQITIDKCSDICAQTRYLLHLDDFDKHQYDRFDIATNDIDTLNRYLNKYIVRDLHDLIGFVQRHHYDLEEIMNEIASYDRWRKYINDLIINYNRKRF